MSLSTMVTVEIEVEVFYTHTEDGVEALNAICQYDVPREVSQWADYDALPYYRCVCCGNCEDRLILKHRHAPSEVRTGIQPRMAGEVKR